MSSSTDLALLRCVARAAPPRPACAPRRGSAAARLLALLLSGGALLSAASARACASYEVCLEQMKRASQAGDYAAAQRAAETAYALRPDEILILNLGNFHQRQGHRAQAIEHYQRFLRSGDPTLREKPELRPEIEARLVQLHAEEALLRAEPAPRRSPAPAKPLTLSWRFFSGLALTTAGLTLTGLGAGALRVDGQCATRLNASCSETYNSLPAGVTMLCLGLAAAGAGVTLFSLDLARR